MHADLPACLFASCCAAVVCRARIVTGMLTIQCLLTWMFVMNLSEHRPLGCNDINLLALKAVRTTVAATT